MLRRLFHRRPDEASGAAWIADLKAAGIGFGSLRPITNGEQQLRQFPPATARTPDNNVWRIERWIWIGNLTLIAVAALGLGLALYAGFAVVALFAAAVMITTVTAGVVVVYHMPDIHLSELSAAIKHGHVV